MTRSFKLAKTGTSLVEVCLALAILAGGALWLLQLSQATRRVFTSSLDRAALFELARTASSRGRDALAQGDLSFEPGSQKIQGKTADGTWSAELAFPPKARHRPYLILAVETEGFALRLQESVAPPLELAPLPGATP